MSCFQKDMPPFIGATCFNLYMASEEITMQATFITVSRNEIAPSPIIFSAPTPSSSTAYRYVAWAKRRPVLTAGGSSDAEIATPTSEDRLPASTDSATPKPDASAMAKPVPRPITSPRLDISYVGQLYALSPPAATKMKPIMYPSSSSSARSLSSVITPCLISFQSLTARPKVIARMGPMMGDTSMDATMKTVLLVPRPMPATMPATIASTAWSKVNVA
mmetsp:Transcript_7656/g.24541  ORF Transcript_7656/g.24541 Transcript_7656/m.24541 type:complete len:219 (-) Transcript_7656:639-1295(-)